MGRMDRSLRAPPRLPMPMGGSPAAPLAQSRGAYARLRRMQSPANCVSPFLYEHRGQDPGTGFGGRCWAARRTFRWPGPRQRLPEHILNIPGDAHALRSLIPMVCILLRGMRPSKKKVETKEGSEHPWIEAKAPRKVWYPNKHFALTRSLRTSPVKQGDEQGPSS